MHPLAYSLMVSPKFSQLQESCCLCLVCQRILFLGKFVPGIGLAIFAGNLWYFYEARSLAKKENRQNVTAQPFGIGASQLTGWLYLIMGPVYWQTGDAELAFQIGLAAALIGGFVEVLGGFIGRWLVSVIPHSALMGNMASSPSFGCPL